VAELKEFLACIWYTILIFLCWIGILFLRLIRLPMDLFEAGQAHAKRPPKRRSA
jgi:hypothetical protein